MIHLDAKYILPGANIYDSVYGNIHKNYTDCNLISQRIFMSPQNETCDRINYHVIQPLSREGVTLLRADFVEESTAVKFPPNF